MKKKEKARKVKEVSKDIEALEGMPETQEEIKKGKKIAGVVITVFFVLTGGMVGVRAWLGREEVVVLSEADAEVGYVGKNEGGVLEEYVLNSLRAQELFFYEFREKGAEEIVVELGELKEGFSRLGKMIGEGEAEEFREVRIIIENDSAQYLSVIRNLRGVMTQEEVSEADKQAEFIKIVEENKDKFRSAVYVSRYAFEGDEERLVTKSGVAAKGRILAEVGGGVMNVFVGDYKEGGIGVASVDYENGVRALKSEHELIVDEKGRMIKIGIGVKEEMEPGKAVAITVECAERGCEEGVRVEKNKIGLVGKTVIEAGEQLAHTGVKGLVKNGELTTGKEAIKEAIEGIEKSRS